jgi:hypothetical protein
MGVAAMTAYDESKPKEIWKMTENQSGIVFDKRRFWTLVYQFDEHCKRLLWVGRELHGEDLRDVFREVSPTGLHVTRIILSFSHSSLSTSE